MRVSFVLPALNEARGIERALARIPREALQRAGFRVDVLVVDGQSTDGTPDRARALGARVLVEPRRGYGRAYKTGLAAAQGDWIVTGDADDSYPFEQAVDILREAQERNLDFATLNRYAHLEPRSMSALHRVGNFILTWTLRLLFSTRLRDSQSGMWVLRRATRDRLPLERMSDGMAFSAELKVRAFRDPGLSCAELPGGYRPRVGQKKLASWRDGWRNFWALVRLRFRRLRPVRENS